MNEAIIDIVGFQLVKLPCNAALHGIGTRRPTIGTALVIRAKVNLKTHFFANVLERFAHVEKGLGPACGQVKVIDPAFIRPADCRDSIRHGGFRNIGCAHSQYADRIACAPVSSVFHPASPPFVDFRPVPAAWLSR